MPILVYSGLGISNMLTAGRYLGSITTGIDRFVLTYSLCHRTVPRLLRERKRMINILNVDSPIAMRYAFVVVFFFLFFFRDRLRAGCTWCTKIPISCRLNFCSIHRELQTVSAFNCLTNLAMVQSGSRINPRLSASFTVQRSPSCTAGQGREHSLNSDLKFS